MWKIFATLRSIFGASQAAARQRDEASKPTNELRSMVFNLTPSELGLSPQSFPHQVWGMVMETGMDRGYHALVVLGDGTTSLYFSTGGAVIGGKRTLHRLGQSSRWIGPSDRLVATS